MALSGVDHDRQVFVVDVDELGGVGGLVAVVRDHGGDAFADEAHDAVGAAGSASAAFMSGRLPAVGSISPQARASTPVMTSATPGSRLRGRDVDVAQAGVGVGAAHDRHVQHAGQLDVVDVGAEAGDQARVFAPAHRLADQLR